MPVGGQWSGRAADVLVKFVYTLHKYTDSIESEADLR